MIFDLEAARVVLTAPWLQITALGTVTLTAFADKALLGRVAASGSAIGAYVVRYAQAGTPFWDEMATAGAIEPDLVTKEVYGGDECRCPARTGLRQDACLAATHRPASRRTNRPHRAAD